MKITISEMPGEGLDVEFQETVTLDAVQSPVQAHLKIKKIDTQVVVNGNILADAELQSSRCLKVFKSARGTRQVVRKLQTEDFKRKVDPACIGKVLGEGAVTPEAREITDYWSKKTIAGLLLMPPTRHCILHWNEGMKIKGKIRRAVSG